jgi:membrane-bound lytic murein transglycosylase MltF
MSMKHTVAIAYVLAALFSGLAQGAPAPNKSDSGFDVNQTPLLRPWVGDLDGIQKRRLLRVLVPYSKTLFFIDRGREYGVAAEFGREFEEWYGVRHKSRTIRLHVTFIPVSRDELLSGLVAGRGDVAIGNLTITPERRQMVDFAAPWIKSVSEVVITGPASPKLSTLDDLAGQEIYVRRSSSYFTHLQALNQAFAARKLPPMKLIAADENLEDEDLMEMINAGLLRIIVVDDHLATNWANIFHKVVVRRDLVVQSGGEIAWALRKNSPQLRALLDGFLKKHGVRTEFTNVIVQRYYKDSKIIKSAYSAQDVQRYGAVLKYFQQYATKYSFDYLMIAAQGYQESQFDQSRRSSRGAVGVMQLLPSTAADPVIGIKGIDKSADRNINAGVKYLRHIADQYLADPEIDARNRTLMAFAGYNAGPSNLRRFRARATKLGLDPNVWFNNVENGAAQIVGRETVQYVSNIYKYYVAYSLLAEQSKEKEEARQDLQN